MPNKLLESEMIPIITSDAAKIINTQSDNWFLTTELNSGYGVADMVLYSLDNTKIEERLNKNLQTPILSKEVIKTVLAFKNANGPISISYLTKQLGVSRQLVKYNIIKFLVESGYVIEEDSAYKLSYDYSVALDQAIAIEAKISNWKRGLYQAYRYKWFSQRSYLALHHKHINPARKNISLFEELNVGLLCVNDSDVDIVFEPNEETPRSVDMVVLANEKILNLYLQKPVPVLQ